LPPDVLEQAARERREQKRYKVEARKKACPAFGAGRGLHGGSPVGLGGVSLPGPANHPNPILILDSLLLILAWVGWWFGAPVGSRGHPWVSPIGGYQGIIEEVTGGRLTYREALREMVKSMVNATPRIIKHMLPR